MGGSSFGTRRCSESVCSTFDSVCTVAFSITCANPVCTHSRCLLSAISVLGDTDLQALLVFAESWEFNAALYALLSNAMDPMLAKFMLAIGCSLLIAYYWVKWRGEPQWSIPRGDWIFGLFLLCAPVINAWYVLWILPFAMLYPSRWAWMASVVVVLAYITSWTLGDFSQRAVRATLGGLEHCNSVLLVRC